MEKTLILFNSRDLYYFNNIQNEQIEIASLFKKNNFFSNIIFKILRKLNSNLTRIFYESWYKNINKFQKIIVFDSTLKKDIRLLENIYKKATTDKLYFYSWNMVTDAKWFEKTKLLVEKAKFRYYSYDEGDCNKYNINFNTIMYDSYLSMNKTKIEYDTVFVGFLKDRKEDIQRLYKKLIDAELIPKFVIVTQNINQINRQEYPFDFRSNYLNYYDYLQLVNKSNAILDIAQQGQLGYSMRVMEAIFLNKKLITTNIHIKDAKFYNENNILIINFDDISATQINEFIDKKFIPYDEKIKKYYSMESWIERFK